MNGATMRDDARREAYERLFAELDPMGTPRVAFVHRTRTGTPIRLGVLAASFNPPTHAHLRMAERAAAEFNLDEIVMELSKANVDKNVTGAPLHERLMMLQRLALSRDWLSIAAATHGRFLDKAMAFHALYPEVALVFIVGTDTLVRVFDGKYYADRERELSALFRVCAFACANRGKEGHDVTDRLLAEPENQAFADRVWPFALDDYHAALSSTQARELLATGARNIPQVPDEVRAYILERGLYRD